MGSIADYDPNEKVEEVGPFEHDDPGHRADPAMPHLLKAATKVAELSPHCGTELEGVQLVSKNSVVRAPSISLAHNIQKLWLIITLVRAHNGRLGRVGSAHCTTWLCRVPESTLHRNRF